MRTIAAFEDKTTLGSLLDLVERGEEIVITRRGKPVARLVGAEASKDRSAARDAAKRIRERAERRGSIPFNWSEWKNMRDEGRR